MLTAFASETRALALQITTVIGDQESWPTGFFSFWDIGGNFWPTLFSVCFLTKPKSLELYLPAELVVVIAG